MVTTTATRPTPRSSHSITAHTPSQRSHSKSSTTPMTPFPRVSSSVGNTITQTAIPHLKSPAAQEVRTPSPNYFGLIPDPASNPRDSGALPKANWSPPTSSIRSLGPMTPQHLPIDSNPEFEAFRRQTETHKGFSLGHGNLSHFASTPGGTSLRSGSGSERRPARSETREPLSPKTAARPGVAGPAMEIDGGGDSFFATKRIPETSENTISFFDLPQQESPSVIPSLPAPRNVLSYIDERHPRLSLPQNRADPPSPHKSPQSSRAHHRADTLPSTLEDGPAMIQSKQVMDLLERLPSRELLLLDLRVFPQFSQSRIRTALNLCIPTTLLKRPSFNLQKLQDTFTNEAEKERFSGWQDAKYIVVYDAMSSEKKDAVSSINTLKKFTNEGWKGSCFILRGGFAEFSKACPNMVDKRSSQEMQSSKMNLSLGGSMPEVAPVAGGCVMPITDNPANPFFSNIRQNQDLIGGVGRISITLPEELSSEDSSIIPSWLAQAAKKEDHGNLVADKFLHLELDEQKRMHSALSNGVRYGSQTQSSRDTPQLAGIEKGSKNRYNNIWPFEHARVKIQGRPEGACDYVNASHVQASRSNKRYIAAQGPMPATFEDFWSVIWDQDVRIIVMLTAMNENGQIKCHSYWDSTDYGPMKLQKISERRVSLDHKRHPASTERRDSGRRRANTSIETNPPETTTPQEPPHAIVRKFKLSHSAHPFSPIREITQVHFAAWPDFGTPTSPSQVLTLIELINQLHRASESPVLSTRFSDPENDESPRPMLVHCSAGCGRTGTFCTIDSVLDMMKRQRKEVRSGVTPMEFMPSPVADYMGKGKALQESNMESDWIFDQDLDLVQKTVEDFRSQRISMVQNLKQYVLCYDVALEWLAQQNPSKITARERSGSHGGIMTRSNTEYMHTSLC